MRKRLIKIFLLFLLLLPSLVLAENKDVKKDEIFRAKVVTVLEQRKNTLPDGKKIEQQNLKLIALEGSFEHKEIKFEGIGNFDVAKNNIYVAGDEVLVLASYDDQGSVNFYITDYVRTNRLFYLFLIFVFFLLLVGGWKGLRSLFSLGLTFAVVIYFIIPKILAGSDPIVITIIGSLLILVAVIYLTEGFNLGSHISVASIVLSLSIAVIFSDLFTELVHLSGLANEDSAVLIELAGGSLNFKGLLLAGIIIGALGVLDDVVVSQVAVVEKILETNKRQSYREVFRQAYDVGISHISSMTNTLFLAYAGVSLPLLVLISSGESAFSSWQQVINSESVAEEVVRTLSGSIAIVLSVPIATMIAAYCYKRFEK